MRASHEDVGVKSTLVAIVFASCGILASCGITKHFNKSAPAVAQNVPGFSTLRKMASMGMICQESECPGFIAHIRVNEENHCTGFLISENRVMTNAHCLKDVEGDYCQNVTAFFQSHGKTVRARCERVIDRVLSLEELWNSSDYAVFEVDKVSSEQPVAFENSGVSHLEHLTVYSTRIDQDSIKIVRNGCTALHSTILAPMLDSPHSNTLIMKNCDILPGDFGSPILRENGTLAGILYQKLDPMNAFTEMLLSEIEGDHLQKSIYREIVTRKLGMGISTSCLSGLDVEELQDIEVDIYCRKNKSSKRSSKSYDAHLLDQLEKIQLDVNQHISDPYIKWIYDPFKDRLTPLCIKSSPQLIEQARSGTKFL